MPRLITHPERLPLLALGMVSLVAGLWAGLLRVGWDLATPRPDWVLVHGPLMVSGFLGTLIALERAVALGRLWGYAVPFLSGLGGVTMIVGAPSILSRSLWLYAALGLLAIFLALARRQYAWYLMVMAVGALLWAVGTGLWLFGATLPDVVLWWGGFLVVTIAGERLELSRFRQWPRQIEVLLMAAIGFVVLALPVSLVDATLGVRLVGAGLVGVACWLMVYDIARRTIAQTGLTRYMAVALLTGYAWLAVSGAALMRSGPGTAGPSYDLVLHTLFLGFVFAMIFAHAPVIFPAVLGVRMAYRPWFYGPLVLLHVSLMLRVIGDIGLWGEGRRIGGLLNAATILVFILTMASSVHARTQPTPVTRPSM
ncbi:MAG: hypothetical protein U0172_01445 [Nitrospiraceae bacterium]